MQIACHLNSYYSEISVSDIASDWSSNRHIIRLVADRYKWLFPTVYLASLQYLPSTRTFMSSFLLPIDLPVQGPGVYVGSDP